MSRPPRQRQRVTLQPRFRFEHLARAEPLVATLVGTHPHQLRRRLHGRHHSRELLRPIAVPADEPRQVTLAERRVLLRQRPQRDLRLSQQPLAIFPRNRPMLGRSLRILAPCLAPCSRRADLVLRLQPDPLLGMRSMIDPRVVPQRAQPLIRQLSPALAPFRQLRDGIPLPQLRAEPTFPHRAHRQHYMRVRLRLAVSSLAPVHVQVGDHPASNELLEHEVPHQRDRLDPRQLARQGDFDVAR